MKKNSTFSLIKKEFFLTSSALLMSSFLASSSALGSSFPVLTQSNLVVISTSATASVMLAQQWNESKEVKGWLMSEKLDGVRGYWTGKKLISRLENQFHAPAWFLEGLPKTPLDGELWIGRKKFAEVLSIVSRKKAGIDWKRVRYVVFDAPEVQGGFEERLEFVDRWFKKNPHPFVQISKQEVCEGKKHLEEKLKSVMARGGEGLMLRRPGSSYTFQRSHDLLKVKKHQDGEARVIGYRAGSGKHQGKLGALIVELPNGLQFSLGTGFSNQERESPPAIGSLVTFKHYGFHKSGIPRFASFLRIHKEI